MTTTIEQKLSTKKGVVGLHLLNVVEPVIRGRRKAPPELEIIETICRDLVRL